MLEPLIFEPILKRIRWGGRCLGTVLHKPIAEHDDYAESWEIADHGDDQSVVAAGRHQSRTLRWLVENKARELFGNGQSCRQFPLLIKYLDARDRLSLQVHPDDALAAQYDPNENGKTEAWIIIEAEPGSRLYAGLKEGVSRTELESALEAGTAEELLHSFPVQPGDCLFIPAGTVHAIGEGIVLAEIQQMSDITFRLFDWGRLGSDGKPRELHVEDGLNATDFTCGPVSTVEPRQIEQETSRRLEELVRGEYFVIHRHLLSPGAATTLEPNDRFHVLMVIEGEVVVEWPAGSQSQTRGGTLLIPASAAGQVTIRSTDESVLIDSFLP